MDNEHSLSPDVIDVLRLIGRKWSLIILHELTHNPMSFGELKETIKGVSASVLSDLLSEFISKEIIEKRSVSISPPRSAYFITSFGAILCDIIDSINSWGEELTRRVSRIKVEEVGESM
ncbi:MAG: helix-turn-helix transcriptional regulator [Candidatus Heimdallarchaeota archaeon]|nr:helix-turn-helix transcriptional regulator [Candidatus Heimdallarchaeota archaeon]